MNETPENRYAPDMEKLKRELGRQPEAPKSSPDDWGRTPALSIKDTLGRANLSQQIKQLFHDSPNWTKFSNEHKECLELIATQLSFICTSPDQAPAWNALYELAWDGKEACK